MKKIVVFGLGRIFKTFLNVYDSSKAEIVALCDNKIKEYAGFDPTKIIEPERIIELEFDYVIITANQYDKISKQLVDYGIQQSIILDFNPIYEKMIVTTINDTEILNLLTDNIQLSTKYDSDLEHLREIEEKNLFLNARIFANSVKNNNLELLQEAEFQVYSQFGEDGIIQWLIHNVDIDQKTFVEFGVEDYSESNTRFLLMNNNWSGFVMDGSEENMSRLGKWKYLWKYDLQFKAAFITKENINQLISNAGFSGDIGILSVDVDGNDYWILNAIDCVSPRILICEYNNIFGKDKKVSVPYDAEFVRTRAHYSNLYWGASLAAFRYWADKNNYYYMGSNSAGNNAFFVRKDCISSDKVSCYADVFVESKYRESRGINGELTYLRGDERLKCIEEMPLIDIESGRTDTIKHLYNMQQ